VFAGRIGVLDAEEAAIHAVVGSIEDVEEGGCAAAGGGDEQRVVGGISAGIVADHEAGFGVRAGAAGGGPGGELRGDVDGVGGGCGSLLRAETGMSRKVEVGGDVGAAAGDAVVSEVIGAWFARSGRRGVAPPISCPGANEPDVGRLA